MSERKKRRVRASQRSTEINRIRNIYIINTAHTFASSGLIADRFETALYPSISVPALFSSFASIFYFPVFAAVSSLPVDPPVPR